ncbi:hypothetical protein CANARDRAFT_27611 [[Candida] arabinofermentans NRRL YB-2248]|uniref:PSP proline-rich domain-containing protein n=1 Tax=[Candida] arabinofermentans NRRL YB-2248 TaxID=983967 RepID=A0A1E4T3Q9_9ASCO|nr:hypothetical protein CANARDRAFT_27611 [[Candida] arabinofermentans NRRL YB-2248]
MPPKKSKNQLRREKLKLKKLQEQKTDVQTESNEQDRPLDPVNTNAAENEPKDIVIETETLDDLVDDPKFAEFKSILRKFQIQHQPESEVPPENDAKGDIMYSDDEDGKSKQVKNTEDEEDEDDYDEEDQDTKLSKRQLRKLYKIPLGILKAESANPELVEWSDADAPDPRLLIYMKLQHNAVQIPKHWSSKRGYLAGKRGIERPPFELPKFILDTGILEMRDTTAEDESTLKQRMRERVQPKMGQLDIDFNRLYDAFFKFQSKPNLLKFGEIYYEGLDNSEELNDLKISKLRPGKLSDELRVALGLVDSGSSIPPWSDRMRMLGPPPSYPYMKIQDDGYITFDNDHVKVVNNGEPIDQTQYGKLESESENEEEEDESEDENALNDAEGSADDYVPEQADQLIDTIGDDFVSSMPKNSAVVNEDDGEPKKLYTVLKETKLDHQTSIYGSQTAAYDMGDKKRPYTAANGSGEADEQQYKKTKSQKDQKFRF